jgi:hypothetical protein
MGGAGARIVLARTKAGTTQNTELLIWNPWKKAKAGPWAMGSMQACAWIWQAANSNITSRKSTNGSSNFLAALVPHNIIRTNYAAKMNDQDRSLQE